LPAKVVSATKPVLPFKTTLKTQAAANAPKACPNRRNRAVFQFSRLAQKAAIVNIGLKCPSANAYAIAAYANPAANAMPSQPMNGAENTIAPVPIKTNPNVPIISAKAFFKANSPISMKCNCLLAKNC